MAAKLVNGLHFLLNSNNSSYSQNSCTKLQILTNFLGCQRRQDELRGSHLSRMRPSRWSSLFTSGHFKPAPSCATRCQALHGGCTHNQGTEILIQYSMSTSDSTKCNQKTCYFAHGKNCAHFLTHPMARFQLRALDLFRFSKLLLKGVDSFFRSTWQHKFTSGESPWISSGKNCSKVNVREWSLKRAAIFKSDLKDKTMTTSDIIFFNL